MNKIKEGFLKTKDKVKIAYDHVKAGHDSAVIICPGFFNSRKNRWIRKSAEVLEKRYDTLTIDFRGHGNSDGFFDWSAKEHMDVEAAIAYMQSFSYKSLGILSYSLGAAASINAVSRSNDITSLICVSAPYDFWQINYHFWEPEMLSDLKDNIACNWEGKGARVGNIFLRKRRPITEVKKIKKTAILFVHGTKDWIIKDLHSKNLHKVARCKKKITLIENGLHAERLVQQFPKKMEAVYLDWFSQTL